MTKLAGGAAGLAAEHITPLTYLLKSLYPGRPPTELHANRPRCLCLITGQNRPDVSISLDISLYPLNADYKAPILGFITALEGYDGFEVMRNPLSTQLYGGFEEIWSALAVELPRAFGAEHTSIAVLKVVSVDVNG